MIHVLPVVHTLSFMATEGYECRKKRNGLRGRELMAQRRNPRIVLTGALASNKAVKTDPLPPGRYWIDLYGDDKPAFDMWYAYHAETVKIEKTEHYAKGGWDPLGINPLVKEKPEGDWIVFTVSEPTKWGMQKQIGYPNVAGPDIQSASDTIQRPAPEPSIFDGIGGGQWPSWVPWVAGAVIVVGGVALFAGMRR